MTQGSRRLTVAVAATVPQKGLSPPEFPEKNDTA